MRDPWFLLAVLAVPLAVVLRRRRGEPSVVFASAEFIDGSRSAHGRSWRVRLIGVPLVLETLGLIGVVLALARPVERVPLPLVVEGLDVLLCLDVSSSMGANDMDPVRSRLDVAKSAAADFITARPRDRIGLIRFARYPDVLCPTTLDHSALGEILADVRLIEPDDAEDATGIGTAVARAAQVLRTSPAKSKIVVLVTDGEENVASAQAPDEIDPARAARICRELGARVYTIVAGVGSRGRDGSWLPIDTREVEQIARVTGGQFFAARDADAIRRVYEHVDGLEKVAFEEPRFVLEDRFEGLLLLAASLWIVGRLLRAAWLGGLP